MPSHQPTPASERVDVLIVGGGVLGLWTRHELALKGARTMLLERHLLGAGQTGASQGILHAGVKYALQPSQAGAARQTALAQPIWADALRGGGGERGAPDLSGVRVLSPAVWLWASDGLASRITLRAAAWAFRADVRRSASDDVPDAFRGAPPSVSVRRADEVVVDARSLVEHLACAHEHPILASCTVRDIDRVANDDRWLVHVDHRGTQRRIEARALVLAAGEGNEHLQTLLPDVVPAPMQRRPLHMVIARNAPCAVFGHCVRTSDKPALTITSIADVHASRWTWYIGGELAEQGVRRPTDQQIAAARHELSRSIGWLDLAQLEYATFRVDRAEGLSPGHKRPDSAVVRRLGPHAVWVGWPTKLALAPIAASQIAREVAGALGTRSPLAESFSQRLPQPKDAEALVAPLPWLAGSAS